jgi:hypothetical protein
MVHDWYSLSHSVRLCLHHYCAQKQIRVALAYGGVNRSSTVLIPSSYRPHTVLYRPTFSLKFVYKDGGGRYEDGMRTVEERAYTNSYTKPFSIYVVLASSTFPRFHSNSYTKTVEHGGGTVYTNSYTKKFFNIRCFIFQYTLFYLIPIQVFSKSYIKPLLSVT